MPDDRLFHTCLGQSDKVNSLTDFEEIVWRDYVNAADDFGVMRFTAVTLQAKFDRLARRPAKAIERALERVCAVDLIRTFVYQNRTYCYQWDWQDWQHVTYPRRTAQPLPTGECLLVCSVHTRWLFALHPNGGKLEGGWKAPRDWHQPVPSNSGLAPDSLPTNSGLAPDLLPTNSSPARTALAVSTSVSRLPLAVSHMPASPGISGPGLDELFEQFKQHYPSSRRQGGHLAERAFLGAMQGRDPESHFRVMLDALEQHTRSEQWQTPKLIPLMTTWLNQERWTQELPEAGRQVSEKTQRLIESSKEFLRP